jgi:hypothetical protein
MIKRGETSWEELVRAGRAGDVKRPGRHKKSDEFFKPESKGKK